MSDAPGKPTDVRQQRRLERRRLFGLVIAFLVVGGSVAIAVVYGPQAGALGLLCLLAGAGILGILWLLLWLIERLAQ